MATLAGIQAALVAKVIAQLSPTVELKGPLALAAPLAAGATGVLSLGIAAGVDRRNSNLTYAIGHLTLWIKHRLAAPGSAAAEAAWLEGAAQVDQLALVDPDFWKIGPPDEVHEVLEMGAVTVAARAGNILAFSVDATVNYLPS